MDLIGTTETSGIDLSPKAERVVARQYMGRVQWEMVLIGTGQAVVWMTTFVLTIRETIPLWLGFVVATVCCCIAYLPSHEGQHGNLSGRQTRWRWLDPAVGQLSLIPLASSHQALRALHLKHHAHTNDPGKDPDTNAMGPHWWGAALAVHRGPNRRAIAHHMGSDQRFRVAMKQGAIVTKVLRLVMLVMVLLFPLPTLLVWWLPRAIGQSYLFIFFSWEPHRPGPNTGRYHDTRFWRFPVPRFLLQSMPTHVVHHLYPTIAHWDEPKALEALRPFMIERGVPGAADVPVRVRFNPLIGRSAIPAAPVVAAGAATPYSSDSTKA